MNLSKPIPIALLPHTVILKTPKKAGIFTDGEYDETALYNVRFEQNEKTRQSKSGENRTRGARIYFDCVNSTADVAFDAPEVQFNASQLIEFCGTTYKIEAIKTVMAGNKVHHYKIEVI